MKPFKFKLFIIILFAQVIYSCKSEDVNPEMFTTEIEVLCFLTDYQDSTASKEIWVGCTSSGSAIRNYIGHCWNFNTDTLPTIISEINKVAYVPATWYLTAHLTGEEPPRGRKIFQTGIPVLASDSKLTVRGFIIFNDTLIRYSDPIVLVNPYEYAN
jgi:hypothetical protein